jgi:hypothetical protein
MENLIRIGRKILYAGSYKNDNQRKLIIILTAFGLVLTLFEAIISNEPEDLFRHVDTLFD